MVLMADMARISKRPKFQGLSNDTLKLCYLHFLEWCFCLYVCFILFFLFDVSSNLSAGGMKRCAEETPKCPQPKPYLGPTINTRPSRPTASSGHVMIMMTLPGLSRKVGKVAQTCGLLPPSPPLTLEFSSIIGECPSDGYWL